MIFERNVAFVGFMLHTLTQMAHISCPWVEMRQRLASIIFTAMIFLFPALQPKLYLKHRDTFLTCFKIGFFSFPLLRRKRGIQRVLDSPATPGMFGFLLDLIKVAWGTLLTYKPQYILLESEIIWRCYDHNVQGVACLQL